MPPNVNFLSGCGVGVLTRAIFVPTQESLPRDCLQWCLTPFVALTAGINLYRILTDFRLPPHPFFAYSFIIYTALCRTWQQKSLPVWHRKALILSLCSCSLQLHTDILSPWRRNTVCSGVADSLSINSRCSHLFRHPTGFPIIALCSYLRLRLHKKY